jgi:hypothetical protein
MKLMKNVNKGQNIDLFEIFAVIIMRILGIIFVVGGLIGFWALSLVHIHTSIMAMLHWHSVQIILACAVVSLAASGLIFYFSRPFARYARRRHEIRMSITKTI